MANPVIDALRPLLSDERARGIERVIGQRLKGVTVLLEELYDHGNIVAIMRTCEALGVQGVHLIEREGEFKRAKKIGRGADKWLSIQVHFDPVSAATALKARGYRLLAADLEADRPLERVDVTQPVALVLGNEHEGITPALRDLCDERFAIPMVGQTQSLNVSCAGAICLYSLVSRVRARLGGGTDLTEEDQAAVRETFYRRSVRASDLIVERALRVGDE